MAIFNSYVSLPEGTLFALFESTGFSIIVSMDMVSEHVCHCLWSLKKWHSLPFFTILGGRENISIDLDELWHYKDSQFHNGMTIAHTALSFQTDMPQGGAPAVISWFWHLLIIDNLPTPAIRVDKPS